MITKKKKEPKSALQRINEGMDLAKDAGLSKDAITITFIAIEIQRLENRVNELEQQVEQLKNPPEFI